MNKNYINYHLIKKVLSVVYFDQQTGAPHAYSWSKSFVSAWKQAVFCCFLHFFPFMTEKEGKIREKLVLTPKNDFDQRTGCRAPVGWSKYTTVVIDTSLTPGNQDQARIWIWNKVDKDTTLVLKAIFRMKKNKLFQRCV